MLSHLVEFAVESVVRVRLIINQEISRKEYEKREREGVDERGKNRTPSAAAKGLKVRAV